MMTLLVAIGSFFGFIIAYHTYGRWLATKIFNLDSAAEVPSKQLRDDIDFVPTKKNVIFGHHFTSIAGTGPIVGPAIAVFWGWLPALLWVVLGSIFIGAVHDFGALIVSMRNRGQTVGEVAGRLINPRARILFLIVLFFALTIVLAIFGLVIAIIFKLYPESVLSVWIAMPIAMMIGYWTFKKGGALLGPSLIALFLLYGAIYVGVEYLPISFVEVTETVAASTETAATAAGVETNQMMERPTNFVRFQLGQLTIPVSLPLVNPTVAWTVILMAYCFLASVLPVWLLLQPRDYVNSHQLFVALSLLVGGLCLAGLSGKADLVASTPAVIATSDLPANSPPIFPFLFITIACGACSGFHCLVSSGTSSKQVESECDAQYVAYGSMLLEGALAVIVILACTAGVGMGRFAKQADGTFTQQVAADGVALTGHDAWATRYSPKGDWTKFKLPDTVGAFVEGGANFLSAIGIPLRFGIGIIATLVACFAATTLDSATRLQRYVIQELGGSFSLPPLQNKYGATGTAVVLGLTVAMLPGPSGVPGTGGLILWPLFGATNQLLAGLAFMVTVFYLWRRSKPVLFALLPMLMMLLMPALALIWQMKGWLTAEEPNYVLFSFGALILGLQIWMVIEGYLMWPKAKGELERQLPPLAEKPTVATVGGPNC
ncbi:carbon starvation CstA family protein [Thalassoglobus polymorphus]|uniref:Carbon starvation protein A n=1 Tax=Thalassoglobus polymorphus TaxID=2527994 RepID=A0A517QRV1_9PLAN|nr:carbon starvation protein A [Thalassoglobus polymorphus]QDT34341.1 Carbon starvation protein A [Thalassoglobus polymorphus]